MADNATMPKDFQFGVGAAAAALPATTRLALESCTVKKVPTHVEAPGMRGQLAHRSEDVAEGTYTVSGGISLRPRPEELRVLLPLMFGGAFATNTLEPAAVTDPFPFSFDRKVKVFNYTGMKFASGSLVSSAGQTLTLSGQLEGTTQAIANAGTFPALDLSLQPPFMHHHAVITIDGSTFNTDDINLSVSHQPALDRFFNSQTRTEIPQGDRMISLSCKNPFTTANNDEYATLFSMALAGVEASIVYTNGAYSLTIEFPCLQAAPQDPDPGGPTNEMPLMMDFTARTVDGSGISDQEIKFTLDDAA